MKYVLSLMILAAVGLGLPAQAESFSYNKTTAKEAWLVLAKVEKENNIPRGLLHSISLVETGKGVSGKVMPWPYTINVNHGRKKKFAETDAAAKYIQKMAGMGFKKFDVWGGGKYYSKVSAARAQRHVSLAAGKVHVRARGFSKRFNSKQGAIIATNRIINGGHNNVDVGLMQINWKYHGENFAGVAEAFEAEHNVGYAVTYLKKHKQTRDWWGSVGRYHSGTKKHADRYIKHVWGMYKRLHKIKTPAPAPQQIASL